MSGPAAPSPHTALLGSAPFHDVPLTPWPMQDEIVLDGDPAIRGCEIPISPDGEQTTGLWRAAPSRFYGVSRDRWVKVVTAGRLTVRADRAAPRELNPGDVLVLQPGEAVEEQIHEPVQIVFTRVHRGGTAAAPVAPLPASGTESEVELTPAATRAPPRRGDGRRALLEAAIRLIARYGTDGVTYRAVAAEAGVQNGLVSYHFRSKDELIHQALAHALSGIRSGSHGARDAGLDAVLGQGWGATELRYRLVLNGRLHPDLRAAVRSLYDGYVGEVSAILDAAGIEHDTALARVVLGALDGLALQQVVAGDRTDADAALESLRALLLERATGGPQPAGPASSSERMSSIATEARG